VIGSRIIEEINQSKPDEMIENVTRFVAGIRTALDQLPGAPQ